MDKKNSTPSQDNYNTLEQWETPVMLKLDLAKSENLTFIGVDDGDSGSGTS